MDAATRCCGRSPHGERGLKRYKIRDNHEMESRSPHGERGLKPEFLAYRLRAHKTSLPSRGAWIETLKTKAESKPTITSLPSRGAWIETLMGRGGIAPPTRRSPHGERGLKHFLESLKRI